MTVANVETESSVKNLLSHKVTYVTYLVLSELKYVPDCQYLCASRKGKPMDLIIFINRNMYICVGSCIYRKEEVPLLGIFLVVILLAVDLEVSQFVRVFVFRYHSQPVAQLVLFQVLLRQVLEVSMKTNFPKLMQISLSLLLIIAKG